MLAKYTPKRAIIKIVKNKKELPKDFESDLKTIAERLYSHHAVVMVGAGFSRNACPEYPTWEGLGNLFYSILNPGEVMPKGHYWNIMDLADELASSKGRSELESVVQNCIKDGASKPSKLHKRLLDLPWVDVFTTNYDTLLEATLPSLIARRYSVVVSDAQLPYAQSPRIVKLHGSFPSTRPYILTSEDYRRYPETHSAFVNTVRQAFLEHTFCLIGFSGDDPNFLNWSGWLRDNLGDYSQPIYLICLHEPSDSRRRLLSRRNIRPIALEHLAHGCNDGFEDGLRAFFDYIEKCRKNPEAWFDSKIILNSMGSGGSAESVIERWRKERESYHRKLVVSPYQRELLDIDLEHNLRMVLPLIEGQDFKKVTDFCYEYLWRLDRTLKVIPDPIRKILNTVMLYWRSQLRKGLVDYDSNRLMMLAVRIMHDCRRMGLFAEWNRVARFLRLFIDKANSNTRDEFWYEEALNAQCQFDSGKLADILKKWNPGDDNPLAQARAGIMYYALNERDESLRLLNRALMSARRISAYSNDIGALHQESAIIWTYKFVLGMVRFDEHNQGNDNQEDYALHLRLKELRGFGCDIWDDVLHFQTLFKAKPQSAYFKSQSVSFDLAPNVTSWGFQRIVDDGSSYLEFCERTALPLEILGENELVAALKSAVPYNIVKVLSSLRYLNKDVLVKKVLTRETLCYLDRDTAELVARQAMIDLEDLYFGRETRRDEMSFKCLLEIESRLFCCDLSVETRTRAYGFVEKVYRNSERLPFVSSIDDFVSRLAMATSLDEMRDVVKRVVSIPLPLRNQNADRVFALQCPALEIFRSLSNRFKTDDIKRAFKGFHLNEEEWKQILLGIESEDTKNYSWSLAAVVLLDAVGVLSASQKRVICEKMFRAKEGNPSLRLGFFLDRSIFAFVQPDEPGLKECYLERNLRKWFAPNCNDGGLCITRGHSERIDNLIVGVEKFSSMLTRDDVSGIVDVVEAEWKVCKDILLNPEENLHHEGLGVSRKEEALYRSNRLGKLLGALEKINQDESLANRMAETIQDMVNEQVPMLAMLVAVNHAQREELKCLVSLASSHLNSEITICRVDARCALESLLCSEYEDVRKEAANVAMSALAWVDGDEAEFVYRIVRSIVSCAKLDTTFIVGIFNLVSRWKDQYIQIIRNRSEDKNIIRSVVYLGRILNLILHNSDLNSYRRGAIVNMYETIAKPLAFSEVREAWSFIDTKIKKG